MKIQQIWQKINRSGFIHVFFANIFSQMVAFCGSIIYVRLMGPQVFGVYSFAYTVISFFLLLNGFGAASGILQFVSRATTDEQRLAYLRYSIKIGVVFNLLLSVGIFIYAMVAPIPLAGARSVLCLMAFFPIGRLYIDIFQSYLRAVQQNQLLAKFAISTNSVLLVSNIVGIIIAGMNGFIIATYLSYIIITLLAKYWFKLPNPLNKSSFVTARQEFIKYSLYVTIGNGFSQLLFLLDILILGYIVKSAVAIAEYKVATVIPFAINFIPGIISSFFYPYFAKNSHNLEYVRKLKYKIQLGVFAFSFSTSMILIVLSGFIINLFFGHNYHNSIVPFQILCFGFWILATLRNINGNVLASLGKAKFAMWLNLFIVTTNIAITYTLVTHYGIIGASIGVVLIYLLSGLIAEFALWRLFRSHA